jgi:hypothetical protein
VLLGLFTGTTIGAGYLLAGVPNVELMTLITALAGAALGARSGFVVGAVAMLIYSLGSPYGVPLPVLLAAQTAGLGFAGVLGSWTAGRIAADLAGGRRTAALVRAGLTGLGATFLFDLLTNLAIILGFEMQAALVLAGALPFFLIHAGVNTALFAGLVPLLLPRLTGLNRGPLIGRSGGGLLAVAVCGLLCSGTAARAQEAGADSLTTAAVGAAVPARPDSFATTGGDSLDRPAAVPAPLVGAAAAFGWKRPLWEPFAPTALDWLGWYSPLVPVRDGGLGASAAILGEAGTSPVPTFTRDGIPVGTGHVLADDPSLVPTENLKYVRTVSGSDGWGGTDGLVALETDDDDPGRATSGYRGIKGNHETYFRAIHVLTPQAAWRAAFEFEESVDNEGYNFSGLTDADFAASGGEFPGHGKVRQSRTRLFRQLDQENRFVVEYTGGRKTKDSLPALGADHQEIWDDGVAATLNGRLGGWKLDTSFFWKNRDVEWGDRDTTASLGRRRKVETGREGVTLALNRAPAGSPSGTPTTGLRAQFLHWRVYDQGIDPNWVGAFPGGGDGEGASALVTGRSVVALGPSRLDLVLGAQWDRHGGWGPEFGLGLDAGGDRPWYRLDVTYGGRAPRSDELLTPLLRVVADRSLTVLPNEELGREKTARAGLLLQGGLLGLDLAVDGSVRRLTGGITWNETDAGGDVGRWENNLALDSAGVTGRLGRQGRFLGWGRLMLEGTWRTFEVKEGHASLLPPEKYLRLHAMWENHFFQEDGILQLALFSTHQGEMADPWDVTRTYVLPSRTVHDLVAGFRLVGAHLSLAFRNLTGERTRLTSGALSTGRETDMRLLWNFRY